MSPKSFGLDHRKGTSTIDMRSFSLTPTYLGAVAQSLKLNTKVKVLNLAGTQLSSEGAVTILSNIPRYLEELDLSNNTLIGRAGVEKAC